jgi:hypothetical protein
MLLSIAERYLFSISAKNLGETFSFVHLDLLIIRLNSNCVEVLGLSVDLDLGLEMFVYIYFGSCSPFIPLRTGLL